MCTWLRLLLGVCLAGVALQAQENADAPAVPRPADPVASEAADPAPAASEEAASAPAVAAAPAAATASDIGHVYVIPIREQIGSAVLYVVRRGIKEAIEQKAGAIVFDMDTPGGAVDKTLAIMEAIGRFPGPTITYVNKDAISAGAFIAAATSEIWFAPRGKMGAAAPVAATGQEIDKSMREKIVSYLGAELRSVSEGKGRRGEVVSAMMDEDYVLEIDGTVLKPKGKLLTLTATEAAKTYGDPPQPLLSAGTAPTLDDLLVQRFGVAVPKLTRLQLTWSEQLASWLNAIAPALLGIGMLALFIEFKTPGFGIFGIVGLVCLGLVFLGNYVAGLSGHEPMVVFGLGLLLVAIEIFFFPGVAVLAITGVVMMLGSLVWSMADLWPKEAVPNAWTADVFVGPLANLMLGVLIALTLGLVLARFLPRGWVWDRLILATAVGDARADAMAAPTIVEGPAVGARGVAVSALRPGGVVEIEGRRYEATVEVGDVAPGEVVQVRAKGDFGLVVEKAKP